MRHSETSEKQDDTEVAGEASEVCGEGGSFESSARCPEDFRFFRDEVGRGVEDVVGKDAGTFVTDVLGGSIGSFLWPLFT